MMRFFKLFISIIVLLALVYLAGPKPETPVYKAGLPQLPNNTLALEGYINQHEAMHRLKPGNKARIIWANDSAKQKTAYAIVYLHGFSASQEEGEPVHRNIAKAFGCNLYLSRLAGHGIDTLDPMISLTPEKYWESAKEALAIGKQLGNKVIIMGTSTGGSNALQLAAAYPNDISALVLLSPNIAINNGQAYLLNNPWGLQIARFVTGGNYVNAKDTRPIYRQYWYQHYPLEAAVQLQELLETTMTPKTFNKVKQPTLMLYYYKDKIHQDSVVSVPAMLQMFDQLGTPANKKFKKAMPNTGDHVIGSYIKSKDVEGVQYEIEKFLVNTIGLKRK